MRGVFVKAITSATIVMRDHLILDDLELNTLAVRKGDKTVLLMAFDTESVRKGFVNEFKALITAETGIPAEAIFVHATHTSAPAAARPAAISRP